MAVQSRLLSEISGIRHAFGTRTEEIPDFFEKQWSEQKLRWNQAHGTTAVEASDTDKDYGDLDAFYTRKSGLIIGVRTADCVPILLARNDGGLVAAVHAGWRGTRARILHALFDQLVKQGEEPMRWTACIGPAIGPCCYEVSEDLAADFRKEFGESRVSGRKLNLPEINADQLRRIGVGKLEVLGRCTKCEGSPGHPTFHSYRREGGGIRQFSMIEISRG